MTISLIIPALNEAESIQVVLDETPFDLLQEVIVVDNGSTDGTGAVAEAGGARIITESRRGYGYACAAGVAAATGEILVFMDGDGSFLPSEIQKLTVPILLDQAELVLGSRMLSEIPRGAMPPHQFWGNRLVAWLVNHLYHLELTDLGPFRAIRRESLERLQMCEMTYGWPVEMMVKAGRGGMRIVEVPVSYRMRRAGQSKVGGTARGTILATTRIFQVVFRYVL